MLEKFEQKVLIQYLLNALQKLKNEADVKFNLKKILDFRDEIENLYDVGSIDFTIHYTNSHEHPKDARKIFLEVINDFESQLKKQYKKFSKSKTSKMEKKFNILQKMFNLQNEEFESFKMFCRNELNDTSCEALCLAQNKYGHCNVQDMSYYYLNEIKHPRKILLNLVDKGLLTRSRGYRGFDFSLPSMIEDILSSGYNTFSSIFTKLVGNILKPNLCKKDFEHLKNEFYMVQLILKNAIEQRTKGINILFYGEVGTGKTEMAKSIARCLKVPLFETICEDSDQDEANRYQRINDLKRKQAIFSQVDTKQLILFDEAEDVFCETMFSRKTESKAFVNKMLEDNVTPVIWTTNDIHHMDKAYLRRFSYSVKFDKLTDDVQLKFMKKEFKKNKFELSDEEILALSKKYDLSSSTISNSIKLIQLTNLSNDKFEYFLNNQMVLLNRGKEASENFNANKRAENYDFNLVNTDTNMEELAQKIKNTGKLNFSLCLYGEAGTGKSEYAKQLADKLGIEVIFKRASDLMSKWVGETEQNIARAFKEARDKKAMLIFDEADSLLQSRGNAQRSWEISQVNEMLTWMESHPYPFICTTNFMDTLDEASLRRFTFKIKFKYMTKDQVKLAFKHFFDKEVSDEVANINGLTAGDFATVCKKISFLGSDDVYELKHMLEEEVKVKKSKELSSNIGF